MKRMGTLFAMAMMVLVAGGCSSPKPTASSDWSQRSSQTVRDRLTALSADGNERSVALASCKSGESVLLAEFGDTPTLSLADASTASTDAGSGSSKPADEAPEATGQVAQECKTSCAERGPLPTLKKSLKRDLRDMPRSLWNNTKAVYGDPWNLALLASMGGASIALRTTGADDHVDEHYQHSRAFSGDWPDTFGALGNPAVHFALAGAWYLAGQGLQHDKTFEVGRKMFDALTLTGISTMFLKVCAWDDSPNGEWGAWPSGHVSSTMAVATVLNHAYGPVVGVPMFGLTALVGIERMDDREHWLSDVVFGAALGWVIAETVMKEHRPEIFGGEILPYVDPSGGAGIAWYKNLGADKRTSNSGMRQ